MNAIKTLSATTLTGALLFTGIGVANSNEAHAAENYSNVNSNNAIDIAKAIDGDHSDYQNYWTPKDKGDYYEIVKANKSNVGSGVIRVYKDGVVKTSWGANNPYETVGQYQLNQSSNNVQTNQTDNRNQSNETNNIITGDDDSQSTQTTNNSYSTNKQVQSSTTVLPETGEQSNSGLVTVIASVLLAAGSLLIVRKTSKSK